MQKIDNLQPEFFRVVQKKFESEDTFTIEIDPINKKKISFLPGQFNMLYAFGIGEVPISISSDCQNSQTYIHTIKIVGNVTKALSRIEEGQQIGVRGPFGVSWPIDACRGKNIVIIAGGIGLAPMRPFIYYLLQNRSQFGQISILYGTREPKQIIFYDELKKWKEDFDNEVRITVDFATAAWSGNVGVVTNLIPRIPFPIENAVALLCGPEIMLRFSVSELKKHRMNDHDIYLAMERNMKCAIGHCGHCQYVSNFICKDGSILPYSKVKRFLSMKEV